MQCLTQSCLCMFACTAMNTPCEKTPESQRKKARVDSNGCRDKDERPIQEGQRWGWKKRLVFTCTCDEEDNKLPTSPSDVSVQERELFYLECIPADTHKEHLADSEEEDEKRSLGESLDAEQNEDCTLLQPADQADQGEGQASPSEPAESAAQVFYVCVPGQAVPKRRCHSLTGPPTLLYPSLNKDTCKDYRISHPWDSDCHSETNSLLDDFSLVTLSTLGVNASSFLPVQNKTGIFSLLESIFNVETVSS